MKSKELELKSQICFPIHLTSRLIKRTYKSFLNKLGITHPQYLVLLVRWEKDKIPINHIAQKLFLNINTLSLILKIMEKLKIINRNNSSQDERIVIVSLNKKGKELRAKSISIPKMLLKTLESERINLSEILQMKKTLNELNKILSIDR